MGFICACCFAGGDSATCKACQDRSCTDCKADKVLLQVEEEEGAPALDAEDYDGFLARLEDTLLPAYREHFENDVRKRFRTRLEVVRAVIFAQAMYEYRRKELGEEGVSPADVRYAVALRSFGKLKKEPSGPRVFHLDPEAAHEKPVPLGRGAWARRSAACAISYLKLLKAPDERAKKIAGIILGADGGSAQEIVNDAFVLERLRKLADKTHDSPQQYLQDAMPALKGEFSFLADQPAHKDARDALICEAGLLIHMTNWADDKSWKKVGRGALARVERVIDEYNDTLPFLTEFYFEDPSHSYQVG
jgi:hypothetical protein